MSRIRPPKSTASFVEVLNAAVSDFIEHGFDNQERLDSWLMRLREAAKRSLLPTVTLQRQMTDALTRVFNRATTDARLMKANPGVSAFTIQNVKPKLRMELQRRILASANLIVLNRDATIMKTLQRFAGWASSVPAGGTDVAKRNEVKAQVKRGIAGLTYEERRVNIDQGHKLVAAINDIVATDGGAIAMEWHHVLPEPGYDPRPDHVDRNGKVYVIRGSWAHTDGLLKARDGYLDEITQPAEEPYCRCSGIYLYTLRDVPSEMLSSRGKKWLAEARENVRRVS